MATTNRKQLHERLFAAAEQLRANSSLKLNEIAEPILGLIFLKFADVKFRRQKLKLKTSAKVSLAESRPSHPITINSAVCLLFRRSFPTHT